MFLDTVTITHNQIVYFKDRPSKCLNYLCIKNEKNNLENEEWREIDFKKVFNEEILTDKKYYVSNLGRFKNSCGTIMENYKINDNEIGRAHV